MLDTILNFIAFLTVMGLGYALGCLTSNKRLGERVVAAEKALWASNEALDRLMDKRVRIEIVDDVDWDAELDAMRKEGER